MHQLSLYQKLVLIVVVPSACFGVTFSYMSYIQARDQAIEEGTTAAVSLLNLVVERFKDKIYYSDVDGINDIIEDLQFNPDFRNVHVLYPDGRIMTDGTKENSLYGNSSELFVKRVASSTPALGRLVEVDADSKIVFLLFPIGMTERAAPIGFIQAEVSLEKLKNVEEGVLRYLAIIIILAGFIASATLVFASKSIVRPISGLRKTASAIAAGDYQNPIRGAHDQKRTADEVQLLAHDLETMRLCIAEANTCLEQKVQDRTYWLQKANEKLESLDKMKDEFIRIASHEIRTPIQPIMMFSDLALRGNIDPTTALKGISVEARRLKALADNILDVSKIEGNKVVLDLRDTNLNQLVDSVAGSFRISNSMKENVKLELQLGRFGYHGNTNDVQCFADSDRLRQILSNIIGNAVKFTMHGTVKVRTSFSKDYCRFVIDVIDSGPGIHPDMIPRLFEKFTTRDVAGLNKNGTGLGLYLSRALVEAHGGEIEAWNNPGGSGATFSIMLPAASKFPKIAIDSPPVRSEQGLG